MMNTLKKKYTAWKVYSQTIRELSQLTNRELDDLGIARPDIRGIAARQSKTF